MTVKRLWLGALLVLTGDLATAQIDSDTLTVAASRQIYAPRDQVLFLIGVTAGPSVGLEEIAAALQGAGIGSAAFSAVRSSFYGDPAILDWSFTLSAPFSKINATIALLVTAQQSIAKQPGGLTLTFEVLGTQASGVVECPLADLMVDAQNEARKLADAAGLSVGPVLELSDQAFSAFAIPTELARAGAYLPVGFFLADYLLPLPQNCMIAVKYKLLRFS